MSNMKKNKSGRNLGMIVFANSGGLGNQTRRLAHMLKPERIMVVDSTGFSKNKDLNYHWYKDFDYFTCAGFPSNADVDKFLQNLTHVFTCENPYNFNLVWFGQKQGTKIYCQSNYEFCDNLDKPYLPVVDKFLMPSFWKIKEMVDIFGRDRVQYLPPPIDPDEFARTRQVNLNRKGKPRFLHVIGTVASFDRNGTLDLLDSVKLTKSDFELVVRTQHEIPMEYFLDDPRVKYEIGNKGECHELYENFDAMILPRRYGGLSLGTNEALMSGLPVIMTDISPNNEWLPKDWLVESEHKLSFFARSNIDVYSVKFQAMADKIDWLCKQNFIDMKAFAYGLALANFSEDVLLPEYQRLFTTGSPVMVSDTLNLTGSSGQ